MLKDFHIAELEKLARSVQSTDEYKKRVI